jgi:Tfp pilus assembly protein PilX
MNKKAILVVTMILGLVALVPLVAASPLLQNQNGDTLNVQDQTQLQDCDSSCIQEGTQDCDQNRTCTQDRQCLQDCDCNDAGICDGTCNETQTQTRQRLGQQECGQAGANDAQQNNYQYQYQFQQKNCQAS